MIEQQLPPLYDKTIPCPICNKEFSSKKVRSKAIRMEKIENDFYTEYKDPSTNPNLYEVYVCPTCGFSFTDQFRKILNNGEKKQFLENVSKNWVSQSFGDARSYQEAIHAYKLALLSGMETNQYPVILGGICLRISWLCRFLHFEEEESRFVSLALTQYENSYMEGDFKDTSMSELKLLFFLGVLSKKVGKIENATKYFSKVVQHKDAEREPIIIDNAREHWYEIRSNK
ncbi:DUF2225 domain-containing protein [Evansella sp. AB-rgal1]|uniref:DUF2225 domain-containing protein n=1 Tax=Evansella sp. AB-rgal1 TaxID=3242696 RepID=UPI00359E883B